jgi:hypothetical protein
MTPKQKAKELFKKYSKGKDSHGWSLCEFDSCAKQCALIAVDLHLEELSKMKLIFSDREIHYKFWKDVKSEIQLL